MHYSYLNDIDFPFVRTHPIRAKGGPLPRRNLDDYGRVRTRLTQRLRVAAERCYSPPPYGKSAVTA